MRDETKMDVYTSGVTGAEYDAGMKQLMSNKEIIVPILQMTVPEFKTCSQEEILQCLDISSITKDDFVSDIPNVEKDLRLTKEDSELSSLVEKLVRFDIRFKIINPKLSTEKIRVNLHIDMEAQKSYRPSNPSYPILKLAVYYVARDLSSQLSTITQTTDYSKLEKCYSIWICAEDVPKKLQNTLTEYSFSKKDIIGVADEPEEDYDLLTVIIIRQGKETEENGVFEYLNGIFDGDMVIVEQQPTADNGDIVVAMIEDSATVKRFYKEDGYYRLQPENDTMDPIIVSEVSIIGKVVGLYRSMK